MDYYSHYIELTKVSSTTSSEVIKHLKSFFSRHGVPQIVVSDNGPQYSATLFKDFANLYGFTHTTSTPYFLKLMELLNKLYVLSRVHNIKRERESVERALIPSNTLSNVAV